MRLNSAEVRSGGLGFASSAVGFGPKRRTCVIWQQILANCGHPDPGQDVPPPPSHGLLKSVNATGNKKELTCRKTLQSLSIQAHLSNALSELASGGIGAHRLMLRMWCGLLFVPLISIQCLLILLCFASRFVIAAWAHTFTTSFVHDWFAFAFNEQGQSMYSTAALVALDLLNCCFSSIVYVPKDCNPDRGHILIQQWHYAKPCISAAFSEANQECQDTVQMAAHPRQNIREQLAH